MFKVSILADSLALPRLPKDGDVPHELTYPFLLHMLLRQQHPDDPPLVIDRGMRARTILDVLNDWEEEVVVKRPHAVIVHVGIVDCAPRVLRPRERRWLQRLPSETARKAILQFIHRHRRAIVSLFPNRVYVSLPKFVAAVDQVMDRAARFPVKLLLFINIVTPTDSLEQRSPGFRAKVAAYNQALAQRVAGTAAQLVDLDGLLARHGGTEALTVDGMHLNATGNRLLAAELAHRLRPVIAPSPVPATADSARQ
jgi:lysophospholipase L1-like esterase